LGSRISRRFDRRDGHGVVEVEKDRGEGEENYIIYKQWWERRLCERIDW